MGTIFTLDAPIKATITAALDDLITELGKMCRFVYPPKWISCPNCIYDSINQVSGNCWKTGGPMMFPNGTGCPMCNGKGKMTQEFTKDVKMLCAWSPRDFWKPIPSVDVRAQNSLLQTKCYLVSLPDIVQCDHLIFETAIEGMIRKKFKLLSAPGDISNIIQGRYAVATWTEITS